MSCEYCFSDTRYGHAAGCPNYIKPLSNYLCCFCNEGIYKDEEFLRNSEGQYIHRDCIPCTDYLIDWLGYRVETMDEEDYKDEIY